MRALPTFLWFLAILAHAPAAAQKATRPGKPTATDEIVAGEIGSKLDRLVQETDVADGGFCGVVLVAARGRVLLQKGYGIADAEAGKPMPADALFDWASVSKQFTAAAVLRLIEASRLRDSEMARLAPKGLGQQLKKWRKLSLDDPLSRFFPDAPNDKANVTLRQLLTHTSGIEAGFKPEWQFDRFDRESFVKMALALPMTSGPGKVFEYSNSGYALVAAIIERVTGTSFERFCVEYVFRPAGMSEATMIGHDTLDPERGKNLLDRVPRIARGKGFPDRPADFRFAYGNRLSWGYRGSGGVVATVRDMFAWDRALRDGKFLGKESLAELYCPALQDYALGWQVRDGGRRVEHSGGVLGVVTHYLRLLDEDVVVALAASYEPKTHPARLADELVKIAR